MKRSSLQTPSKLLDVVFRRDDKNHEKANVDYPDMINDLILDIYMDFKNSQFIDDEMNKIISARKKIRQIRARSARKKFTRKMERNPKN